VDQDEMPALVPPGEPGTPPAEESAIQAGASGADSFAKSADGSDQLDAEGMLSGGGAPIGRKGPLPTDPEELIRILLDNTITASISAVGVVAGGFATRLGTKVSKAISKLRKKKAGKPKLKGKRRKSKKKREAEEQKNCLTKCKCYDCQTPEQKKKKIRKACSSKERRRGAVRRRR